MLIFVGIFFSFTASPPVNRRRRAFAPSYNSSASDTRPWTGGRRLSICPIIERRGDRSRPRAVQSRGVASCLLPRTGHRLSNAEHHDLSCNKVQRVINAHEKIIMSVFIFRSSSRMRRVERNVSTHAKPEAAELMDTRIYLYRSLSASARTTCKSVRGRRRCLYYYYNTHATAPRALGFGRYDVCGGFMVFRPQRDHILTRVCVVAPVACIQ